MSDFDSLYQRSLYLSPDQQDLLLAALASGDKTAKMANGQSQPNPPSEAQFPDSRPNSSSPQVNSFDNTGISNRDIFESPPDEPLDIAQLGFEGSPFLGFDLDVDFDPREDLIGDLPGPSPNGDDIEQGEKRKSIDGNEEAEGGKKRRETDDKMAKKPGRKPLTSEPTTKRKAQNRAAQRAFRERKEKHLKDLETKVEELEKISQSTNTENKLLRAQVERLQGEVKEYRKRLPWVNGGTSLLPTTSSRMRGSEYRDNSLLNGNDFSFQFPKFGDLPGSHMFGDGLPKAPSHQAKRGSASPTILGYDYRTPATSVNSFKSANVASQPQNFNLGNTPQFVRTPDKLRQFQRFKFRLSLRLFRISASLIYRYIARTQYHNNHNNNTNNSSNNNINFPGDGLLGIDWLAQQNGGQFDPVLFGDYRDPQDAVLSQDFGNFFNDALPFPEFGGSLDSLNELSNGNATTTLSSTTPQKHDLLKQIDNVVEGKDDEEVVPAEDPSQMLSCTKIWDRLQSMEKFRNGEIDVDSLCSELRTKARCSEGGVVVKQDDVEAIISRAE
ncbi:conserved hypothetical protein [Histoplasma capsulatum G186AR]|uniref:BZIP domain-containing protein n=1 Tax=Ajellomyces capsulatus (strain G186AR / H82 / ATCC MYA-2454 / RMSCC 2432) TaxID=447093 RepID=C0NRZ4_AJECG|nr:uncharacterized protein HCBG_05924 [Histoplasma capsulatum G186AR]EEH05660.1 conserved hypothetical protein [Histoplasma capsulatum G186AR]